MHHLLTLLSIRLKWLPPFNQYPQMHSVRIGKSENIWAPLECSGIGSLGWGSDCLIQRGNGKTGKRAVPVATVPLPLTVPTEPDLGCDHTVLPQTGRWGLRAETSAGSPGRATVIQMSLGQLSCTNHPLNQLVLELFIALPIPIHMHPEGEKRILPGDPPCLRNQCSEQQVWRSLGCCHPPDKARPGRNSKLSIRLRGCGSLSKSEEATKVPLEHGSRSLLHIWALSTLNPSLS